jgi:hypothetical protein
LSEIVSPYVLAVAEELLVVVVVPEPIDAAFSMAALESTGDPLPPAVHGACPFLISKSILSIHYQS